MGEKFNVSFLVRLTSKDHEKLLKLSEKRGEPASAVVRRLIRDGSVLPAPYTKDIREEMKQLMRLGNNINQLAAVANTHGQIEDSKRLQELIDEIEKLLEEMSQKFD